MTLTIHQEEDDLRQLKVTVEVPEDRVQEEMRRAARKLAGSVRVPGFRKGKVPYQILVNYVGEESLRAEAVEEMLEPVLAEALADLDVVAYGRPSLDDLEVSPLVLRLTVPLEPIVRLGDYRATRQEIEPVEISDADVEEALDHLRNHHEVLTPVERPAELGDAIRLTGEAKLVEDGRGMWRADNSLMLLDPEQSFPGVPVVENLVGVSAGDQKEFTVDFPETYENEEVAGKALAFSVSVEEVQNRELPPLDDELAAKEGAASLDGLRARTRDQLVGEAERAGRTELLDSFVDGMAEAAEIVYPPGLIDAELDDMVEETKAMVRRSGLKWEDYLKLEGGTEESLRAGWQERATTRVTERLVLRAFVEAEKLEISEADIDRAVEERLAPLGDNAEMLDSMRSFYRGDAQLARISNDILLEKVYDRVRAIVTGMAPDLAELEATAAAADDAAVDEEE